MARALDDDILAGLRKYTACDVSDALLKLKVPGAGFIPDLSLLGHPALQQRQSETPTTLSSNQLEVPGDVEAEVTVGPVSTVLFAPKGQSQDAANSLPAPNIPKNSHWADLTHPGTIVVLQQPPGQTNAVCGGIMALRMKVRQVLGIVVAGRARDITELRGTGLPIWARGTSTIGVGGGNVPWATQVPLDIDGTQVNPGDIAISDPVNGVVVIPRNKVHQVLELLPKLTSADDKAKEDVANGVSVFEAFKRHRSNL
jgi:regulator of RNase E activity RraA